MMGVCGSNTGLKGVPIRGRKPMRCLLSLMTGNALKQLCAFRMLFQSMFEAPAV